MKFGVPWSVKGIRPEARETARQAARRSGMSLGDWLNTMILQQSAQGGMQGQFFSDEEDSYGKDFAGVHHRLDDLTRRIEQFMRKGPEAYAPRHHQRAEPDQLAALIERLNQRIEQFSGFAQAMQPMMAPPLAPSPRPDFYAFPQGSPPDLPMPPALDRAVAEVAARQRALKGEQAPLQQTQQPQQQQYQAEPPMARPPLPTQDISGLEEQLRKITDQIETLRRPGVEEAIQALRDELGDIGRALNDAMPRRTIDTLERQIQGLTQRIAEGRQSGADGGTLSNIEYGLSEVRDALRGLTPAENLIGFNDAVAALAQKIDLIVAQKDPATLQQLESAITMLRSMAGNVASDEAVSRLAEEVQVLAEKVEQIGRGPAGDVLNSLEARIDALSGALAERVQSGNSVPPRLELLVQSLSDKIEQIQHSGSDSLAINHLEDRIVHLVEKLDASEGRLGHLEAIERGLADLLVHIEDMRTNGPAAASNAEPLQAVDELKSDIARTHDSLDAVHGTLGVLVDRMVMLEKNMRAERPAAPPPPVPSEESELKQPPGRVAVRLVSDQPPPEPPVSAPAVQPPSRLPPVMPLSVAPPPSPEPPPPRRMTANRPPIDPDLPPDQPLEPGSGRPRIQEHPSVRIAASEAALGSARPAAPAAGNPANFIAAARRAAQAALRHQPAAAPHVAEPAPHEGEETDGRSTRAKMMTRMKSLFIAASIVAIVVGSIQIVGSMLLGGARTKTAQEHHAKAAHEEIVTPEAKAPVKLADRPATTPTYNMLAPPGAGTVESLFNPPPLPSSTDITGSIPETTASKPPAVTNRTRAQDGSDGLPSEIGSQALRKAATSGNAAAAYEVALRFAEGRGVSTNLERAAHWYERAASKGLPLAQFRYASMLEKGQGVKKDLNAARKLYLAAAGQGNAKAMHNLAVLYAEGIDGHPDYATAAKWFRDAAQHGVADSQYNLAILYARGIGVPKDMGESYKWFALAAAHGDQESAKKRDELASHLDAKGLAKARHEVATFMVKPQPASATTVPVPPGGWDHAAAPPAKSRPHSAGAMVIGRR
jgi:localization factor PodJL